MRHNLKRTTWLIIVNMYKHQPTFWLYVAHFILRTMNGRKKGKMESNGFSIKAAVIHYGIDQYDETGKIEQYSTTRVDGVGITRLSVV
jgi:hypothetical protein